MNEKSLFKLTQVLKKTGRFLRNCQERPTDINAYHKLTGRDFDILYSEL